MERGLEAGSACVVGRGGVLGGCNITAPQGWRAGGVLCREPFTLVHCCLLDEQLHGAKAMAAGEKFTKLRAVSGSRWQAEVAPVQSTGGEGLVFLVLLSKFMLALVEVRGVLPV